MKIKFSILLIFLVTYSLLANDPTRPEQDYAAMNTKTVVLKDANADVINPPTITNDSANGGVSDTRRNKLNSILFYSILIFLSVLVIILIDNRNLQRQYKKLASDSKNKDPLL